MIFQRFSVYKSRINDEAIEVDPAVVRDPHPRRVRHGGASRVRETYRSKLSRQK